MAEEIPSIGRSLSKINGFVEFIQSLRSKEEVYTVRELLEEVIRLTGYVDELRAEGTDEAEARIENIDELISKAETYQETMEAQNEPATLSGFLEEIALVADIDSVDPDQDYVLLSNRTHPIYIQNNICLLTDHRLMFRRGFNRQTLRSVCL